MKPIRCETCNGTGRVAQTREHSSPPAYWRDCSLCGGTGKIGGDPDPTARAVEKTIELMIPHLSEGLEPQVPALKNLGARLADAEIAGREVTYHRALLWSLACAAGGKLTLTAERVRGITRDMPTMDLQISMQADGSIEILSLVKPAAVRT